MVRSGEGTAEGSTCFAIAHVAVGKEEAVLGSKAIRYLASFAHETVLEFGRICYARTIIYDRVLADDADANSHDGSGYALKRAVAKAESSVNDAAI